MEYQLKINFNDGTHIIDRLDRVNRIDSELSRQTAALDSIMEAAQAYSDLWNIVLYGQTLGGRKQVQKIWHSMK